MATPNKKPATTAEAREKILAALPFIIKGRREHGLAILSVWDGIADFDHDNITAELARARIELEKLRRLADSLNRELEQLSFRADFHLAIALDPERRRLDEIKEAIRALVAGARKARSDLGKGRAGKPRKVAGVLFVQEASEVYEYLTGLRPERDVDRNTSRDCGHFFDFTRALWIARRGAMPGLSNSIKRWAEFRKSDQARSGVIAHLASYYPEFGLVVEQPDNGLRDGPGRALPGRYKAASES
jgi:hypothetical protein